MNLTIGRKLALGFGTVFSLLMFFAIIIILLSNGVAESINFIVEETEPLNQASYEMEINILELRSNVLDYVLVHDPIYREEFEDSIEDFDFYLERYRELAHSQLEIDLYNQISQIYSEFATTGRALMDSEDRQADFLQLIYTNYDSIDNILDDQIQINLSESDERDREVAEVTEEIEVNVGEVGTWLGSYLANPIEDSRIRIFDNISDARNYIALAKTLPLTFNEQQAVNELDSLFEATVNLIQNLLNELELLQSDMDKFLQVAVQIDLLLDDEIQVQTAQDLKMADEQATSSISMILSVSVILTIIIGGISLFSGLMTSRSIIRRLAVVIGASERVAEGKLDERAIVSGNDEISFLAHTFNSMVESLQESMESVVAKEYLENVVNQYQQFVARVAEGDLTAELNLDLDDHHDQDDLTQLGVNLLLMVDNLRDIARQVRQSSSSVISATTEIEAAASQQLATTTEQSTAVTQTVATVDEIRTTVQQTAERSQTVSESARQSVEVSQKGEVAVEDSVKGMEMIRERVENIAETILALSGRTQQIGEIIETVDALADQSKLLALNASIEAARAGEEGRGFAVVAMEVRQLAEQSRQATARINDILNEIQQATNTAVMATEEGSKGTERGMELVIRAGDAIRELAATLSDVNQAAAQIAASTHQQTNGMDQLSSAMQQIKQASVQAAASTRQAEQSARDLTHTARLLEDAVSRYKTD